MTMSDFREIQRDLETKGRNLIRRVRTPEGSRRFGQPIGSIIVPDLPGVGNVRFHGTRSRTHDSAPDEIVYPINLHHSNYEIANAVRSGRPTAGDGVGEIESDFAETRRWKVQGRRSSVYTWYDEPSGKWVLADHKDNLLHEGDSEEEVVRHIDTLVKRRANLPPETVNGKPRVRATGKHIQAYRQATEEDLQKLVDRYGAYMTPPPAYRASAMVADMDGFEDHEPPLKWRDSKGRVQPRYSKEFRDKADAAKFDRGRELVKSGALQKLDAWLVDNWRTDDTAAALFLMRKTGMRPSSEDNETSGARSFGATTIQARHVTVNKNSVKLNFVGKKQVSQDHTYEDPDVVELFRIWSDGKVRQQEVFPGATEHTLRAAMKEHTGGDYKVYDLRTMLATELASMLVSSMGEPSNKTEFNKMRKEVGRLVAEQLGNTGTVALNSYIDPAVFTKWQEAI